MVAAAQTFSQQLRIIEEVTDSIDCSSSVSDRIVIATEVRMRGRRKCSDNADTLVEQVLDVHIPLSSEGVGNET